jgi:hypothetical protein
MIGSQLISLLIASVIAIAFGSAPLLAATCEGLTDYCLKGSIDPDKVAKCTAAGQSCQNTGMFVGPYSGKSVTAQKGSGAGSHAAEVHVW